VIGAVRRRALPLGLGAVSFALALLQSPGRVSFETKVDLHVDPTRFLSSVASVWSSTGDLGHVQSSQYVGYLFPMGPWFAAGHLVGAAAWLVDRLWLGAILALAGWGVVRLLDALLTRRRGIAHTVAALAYLLNPFVVTLSDRTSVFLTTYAALPWLLLAVHRGLRHSRSWWFPAAFALVLAAAGGGVNAATVAWVLLAPVLLAGYEVAIDGMRWRAVLSFGWRALLSSLAGSLWWVGGVLIGGAYGLHFLSFIEQPGTIWGTTSASEALRGMGYWISYTGVAFSGRALPQLSSAPTLLFSRPVLLASLLVPGLALAGFVWTRRWRYGPFFLLLALVGVGVVVAGFPEGTPLRHGLYFLYNRVSLVQFLRTSYKAAPLIVLGVSVLLGAGCAEAAGALGRVHRPGLGRVALRVAVVVGAVALLAVSAWPLTSGDAVGLRSRGVPAAWREAAAGLNRGLPSNARAVVLPGQLFSFYGWGGTVDPILPALSRRPVAVRSVTPYADLHSTDLLWTIDRLVAQQRLYPGELRPLLSLIGARAVISGSDDDLARSGSVAPDIAAAVLAGQGLSRPAHAYGPDRVPSASPDAVDLPAPLPEVRRYDLPAGRGIVSVAPQGAPTIVDGSAEALAGLAAFGALPPRAPILYAGDQSPARLRALAGPGSEIVISDTNRRQVFVNARPFQNLGPTVAAADTFSADAAVLDPFAGRGSDAQTVQALSGARYIRAPYSPQFSQFPEHRPFAAFDGSAQTAWLADRELDPSRRWVEIGFTAPRDVPYVDVLADDEADGSVRAVEIAGRRFALRRGWNRLRLGLRHVASLRVAIASVAGSGAGGLREVRVPGLRVSEALRVPVLAERALAGAPLTEAGLTYLFERTTGDDPLQRMRGHGPWQATRVADAGDGETGLRRRFAPPARRAWAADAWLSLSPLAPDSELDRVAGYSGPVRVDSSGRYLNEGRFRASSAFDGRRSSAWVGQLESGSRPWIGWRAPAPLIVSRLRLRPAPFAVRTPATVTLALAGSRPGAPLVVGGDGTVTLPRPLRGRDFRLTVLRTRRGAGPPAGQGAVGIGEIEGAGIPAMAIPRAGRLRAGCGAASFSLSGRAVPLRVEGDVATLDAGGALRARQCSAPVALGAGPQRLSASSGTFRIDWLRLDSPAPVAGASTAAGAGSARLLGPGRLGRTSVSGVRVALRQPSWLILGESYNRGWRASCSGHALGAPTVIDGYANGWRVPASCRTASFSFAPQQVMTWLYVISAIAAVLLVGLVLFRRAPAVSDTDPEPLRDAGTGRAGLPRAVAFGALAGVGLGFVFGVAPGVLIALSVALILWRGVGARALALGAGALLVVVVPAIYMTAPGHDLGGSDAGYAEQLISAHWVAVAALVLALLAAFRALARPRAAPGARPVQALPPPSERTSTT
jgi:arabinofuranan 3-O-arabinosyltransferase